jgi:hypothetical protein
MTKHVSPKELARLLHFTIPGKLKRLPDCRYGITGRDPLWIDEAGNEYHCGRLDDVCIGCIVTADGRII